MQHQILSIGEVKAIFPPHKNQGDNKKVWVADLAVTKQPKTDSKEVFSDKYVSSISKDQIQQIQHEDQVMISVIKLKKQKLKHTNKKQSAQPVNVKKLLRHWARLKIIDNILCRESGQKLQLVLPSKLHSLIYEELHSKMGHLSPEKVYQLSKEKLFWSGMEEDIVHSLTRICSCVKKLTSNQ